MFNGRLHYPLSVDISCLLLLLPLVVFTLSLCVFYFGDSCEHETKDLRQKGLKGTRERLAFVKSLSGATEGVEETRISYGATSRAAGKRALTGSWGNRVSSLLCRPDRVTLVSTLNRRRVQGMGGSPLTDT